MNTSAIGKILNKKFILIKMYESKSKYTIVPIELSKNKKDTAKKLRRQLFLAYYNCVFYKYQFPTTFRRSKLLIYYFLFRFFIRDDLTFLPITINNSYQIVIWISKCCKVEEAIHQNFHLSELFINNELNTRFEKIIPREILTNTKKENLIKSLKDIENKKFNFLEWLNIINKLNEDDLEKLRYVLNAYI